MMPLPPTNFPLDKTFFAAVTARLPTANTMGLVMTPEGRVKDKVKRILKGSGYWFMPVQNGMGAPALDFYCCVNGYFLAIETKAEGKKPSDRQIATAESILQHRGGVLIIVGMDGAGLLPNYLTYIHSLPPPNLPSNLDRYAT